MLLDKVIVLAIVFSSLPFAFSESTYTTEESLVVVPFDYHGQSCWLESESVYQCTWQGYIEPNTIEALEQFKHALTEEQYQEQVERLELKSVPIVIEPEFTERELQVQELSKQLFKGEATVEESVLYHLLTQLDTCQQGMDSRTEGIQNAREFEISSFKQWSMNNVPYDSEIGTLVKNIEECEAQQVLAYNVVGAGYMNMVHGEDDVQYSLLTELEGIQALDFELYNKNSARIDMNGICNNNQYDWNNRILMGCEDTREYEGSTNVNPKGYITYYSDSYSQYKQFLNEYGNRVATSQDKDNAEKLAEPILKEMLEKNLWYNRE